MNKILVYPIGGLSEMRLSRLIELELAERGADVTSEANEAVSRAMFVVGILDDETAEIVKNIAPNAEKIVCYRYSEIEADGFIAFERPFDVSKLCDGLTRFQKREKDQQGLEFENGTVTFRGEKIDLSKKEFELLRLLYSKKGEAVSRSEARALIFPAESDSNVVDVYIRYLRKKLDLRFDTRMIITVRNRGYMLQI
jgi:hypothetical protein